MIFIANSSGTIVNSKVETVYQGTDGAKTIFLICPYMSHSSVTASFTLPNGITPDAYTMTYMRTINADDDAAVQGWSLDVPATVTAYYGIVSVRFTWYSSTNAVIASSVTTFRVARGIAAALPDSPDEDTYEKILAMLADITEYTENIQARVDSLSFHSSTVETDGSSTTTLELNTVSVEDDAAVQEGDYVVTASNDIYRIDSIDDDTGEMTVSFIMNIRGTDTLVQSDVWVSDKTLTDGASISISSDEIAFNRTPTAGDWFLLIKQNESGDYEKATYIAYATVTTVNDDNYIVKLGVVTRISAIGFVSLELTASDGENDTYTITFTDGTTYEFALSTKVDLTTYTEEQEAQDSQISANTANIATNTKNIATNTSNITTLTGYYQSVQSQATANSKTITDLIKDVGNIDEFNSVADNVSTAIRSLNEDIDSLQLGVVPRVIRGLIYDEEPETLDDELKAALTAAVKEATGRDTPNNTDAVKVMDSAAPAEDSMYTYFYWSGEVSSDLDGWYLAEYYLSPSVTSIPSFIYVIKESSWSDADENGLYYISISPDEHGMGTDNSINVDLHRLVDEENYESVNQFYVTASGTVILYTDELFTGKLIIRTGKAYYITTESVEISQVSGLQNALDEKANTDDVADALDEKANTADLATVATSGSYNDLTDTPTAATTSSSGLMSASDKAKLDGIDASANNYSLPTATSTVLGGVMLGSDTVQSVSANSVTATSSRTYAVQANSSGQLVVNVPWANTTVTQTNQDTNDSSFPVLARATTSATTSATTAIFSSKITMKPNSGTMTATSFVGEFTGDLTGNVYGNADTATMLYGESTTNLVAGAVYLALITYGDSDSTVETVPVIYYYDGGTYSNSTIGFLAYFEYYVRIFNGVVQICNNLSNATNWSSETGDDVNITYYRII